MIAHSIQAALNAKSVSRVVCSTDSPEIAAVAQEYGAEVPFLRPAELASDQAGMLGVLQHAGRWLESKGVRVARTPTQVAELAISQLGAAA